MENTENKNTSGENLVILENIKQKIKERINNNDEIILHQQENYDLLNDADKCYLQGYKHGYSLAKFESKME